MTQGITEQQISEYVIIFCCFDCHDVRSLSLSDDGKAELHNVTDMADIYMCKKITVWGKIWAKTQSFAKSGSI